ncbi:MAG: signal peptidase II [Acidobacteria bacterium]|nr:MAG: signal peptidase II [Acidobacteriota bacterium]
MSRAALRSMYFLVSAVVILLDRLTKLFIRSHIEPNFGSVIVIPKFFSITHVENTGAAFSLFADWPQNVRVPLLVGFSTLAMLVVSYLLWKSATKFTFTGLALALILGGAVGNLYDRILFGRVTDFLHFYIGPHSWPDFNVADSAIVCGAALLLLDLILCGKGARVD